MKTIKKTMMALVVLMLITCLHIQPIAAKSYKTGTYKTKGTTYLYKGKKKSKKLTKIAKAKVLTITKVSGSFGKTTYKKKSGYVYLPELTFVSSYTSGDYQTSKKTYLYAKKSKSGKKLVTLDKHTFVTVKEVDGQYGKVKASKKTGYVYLPYLTTKFSLKKGTYQTNKKTYLYAKKKTGSSKIKTIAKNTNLVITSISGTFGKTTYKKKTGYVDLKDAAFKSAYKTGTYTITAKTYLYKKMKTSSSKLKTLSKYTVITIKDVDGSYGKAVYQKKTGYVLLTKATFGKKTSKQSTSSKKSTTSKKETKTVTTTVTTTTTLAKTGAKKETVSSTGKKIASAAYRVRRYLETNHYTYKGTETFVYKFPISYYYPDVTVVSCSSYLQEVMIQAGFSQFRGSEALYAYTNPARCLKQLKSKGIEARILEDGEELLPGDLIQRKSSGHIAVIQSTRGSKATVYEVSKTYNGFHQRTATQESILNSFYGVRILS